MSFDYLNIPGDYSDYDILEEEKEIISLNDKFWVKTKKEIWRGRVVQIPYSNSEQDSEHLKIKWIDSRKEERVLIKKIPIDYSKTFSVPTQQ